jgi:hypothetical protein
MLHLMYALVLLFGASNSFRFPVNTHGKVDRLSPWRSVKEGPAGDGGRLVEVINVTGASALSRSDVMKYGMTTALAEELTKNGRAELAAELADGAIRIAENM